MVEPLVDAARFGGLAIGTNRCFVIAEAGVNHNGDEAMAHDLVDAAADAGADAVKFQSFDADLVVAADAAKVPYQTTGASENESQRDLLRRLSLPPGVLRRLAAHAATRQIVLLSTPFDARSVDVLRDIGVPLMKVPSGEITNQALLIHIARTGLAVVLSTGMSTLDEVAVAVDVLIENGTNDLALLHCVSCYPALPADCNLRAMDTLAARFGLPVGWSDHTDGITIALAACARGAALLEKHLTLDRGLPGPDHTASIERDDFARLVAGVRAIEAAFGDGIKRPTTSELAHRASIRRSLHASRDLLAGDVLGPADVIALRPERGVPPPALPQVVGRTLRANVPAGAALCWSDLE